jgi:RNA polymerase sigma-70 factor (ECF subfamily)
MGIAERDAPDECQKVFMVAYRRLADFEGRSSLKTWLCGIALHVAKEYKRRIVSRREVFSDETSHEPSTAEEQIGQLEHRERLSELDAVLSQIPFEQRTVLVLFELEEMSGEEIAALLGVPEGTVRSRLRLARQAFSRMIALRNDSLRRVEGGVR